MDGTIGIAAGCLRIEGVTASSPVALHSGSVKLLVFGTSDSDGSTLEVQDEAWPERVAAGLTSSGTTCEMTHKRFYATAPGAADYLDRQLRESDPDIVVLSVTLHAFSVKTVANRVRRVAGDRAGDWAAGRVRWFDAATGGAERNARRTWRRRVNRAAHWSARRVIGTASEASAKDVWKAYARAIERLARDEDRTVVVIGSTPFTATIERENRSARRVQQQFNRRLAELCRERRIGWVDPERMRIGEVDELYSDMLHFDAAAHEKLAAMVLDALAT